MKNIRINQVKLNIDHEPSDVISKAIKTARVNPKDVISSEIIRQSIDARKKDDIHFSYVVDLKLNDKARYDVKNKNIVAVSDKKYDPKPAGEIKSDKPFVIIGAGPAGLFCAYELTLKGYKVILLERGEDVDKRTDDVDKFWEDGTLMPESNVQFGEGGAGTFSDGKLNTLVKDKYGRNRYVLKTFVKFGADPDIEYSAKPHVGTDVLKDVIKNIRNEIISNGGEVRFNAKVTDLKFEKNTLKAVVVNDTEVMETDACVLAIGHSARDTFKTLKELGMDMECKPFAVGFRVEHPQSMINADQYGSDNKKLPVAPYKVTYTASNGRGVYSFCMCPGGYVVNASSEEKRLAVNGMSYRARASANANSAIIMSVNPSDYGNESDPLSGVEFQRRLEEKAYKLCDGKIPQQLFIDYKNKNASTSYGSFESCHKGVAGFSELSDILPSELREAFLEGMSAFGRKIKGFDRDDAILSAIESRTSSPVRITRDEESLESTSFAGIYPCGEGAGYAGGIMSAAMDGLKCAEAIMNRFMP